MNIRTTLHLRKKPKLEKKTSRVKKHKLYHIPINYFAVTHTSLNFLFHFIADKQCDNGNKWHNWPNYNSLFLFLWNSYFSQELLERAVWIAGRSFRKDGMAVFWFLWCIGWFLCGWLGLAGLCFLPCSCSILGLVFLLLSVTFTLVWCGLGLGSSRWANLCLCFLALSMFCSAQQFLFDTFNISVFWLQDLSNQSQQVQSENRCGNGSQACSEEFDKGFSLCLSIGFQSDLINFHHHGPSVSAWGSKWIVNCICLFTSLRE